MIFSIAGREPGGRKDGRCQRDGSQADHKRREKKEGKAEEENYYRSERSFGSFRRSLELPSDVQAEKAKASFRNGILEVRLPKTEAAKAKEIKVAVEEGPTTSVGRN